MQNGRTARLLHEIELELAVHPNLKTVYVNDQAFKKIIQARFGNRVQVEVVGLKELFTHSKPHEVK